MSETSKFNEAIANNAITRFNEEWPKIKAKIGEREHFVKTDYDEWIWELQKFVVREYPELAFADSESALKEHIENVISALGVSSISEAEVEGPKEFWLRTAIQELTTQICELAEIGDLGDRRIRARSINCLLFSWVGMAVPDAEAGFRVKRGARIARRSKSVAIQDRNRAIREYAHWRINCSNPPKSKARLYEDIRAHFGFSLSNRQLRKILHSPK